jgi:hypothetical protein
MIPIQIFGASDMGFGPTLYVYDRLQCRQMCPDESEEEHRGRLIDPDAEKAVKPNVLPMRTSVSRRLVDRCRAESTLHPLGDTRGARPSLVSRRWSGST